MGSKNKSLVDVWLEDDNLMLLECWARDGLTNIQIADKIGISPSGLTKWMNEYEEIRKAVKAGKEIVDYKVENALLKSALGYTTKEIKVIVGKQNKSSQMFEITKETTTKEIAPNVTACLAWLNNRRPDKWKRNRDKEIEIDEEDNNLSITIIRGKSKDQEIEENVNKEIKIESKKNNQKEEKTKQKDIESIQEQKKVTSKKMEEDKDYWPDDWEDED